MRVTVVKKKAAWGRNDLLAFHILSHTLLKKVNTETQASWKVGGRS